MKRSLTISVLLVTFLMITIFVVNGYSKNETEYEEEPIPWGEKEIIRSYETEEERTAIYTAEHLPLISIFNRTRFETFEDTNDPTDVIKPFGISWFKVIDNVTIDAYTQRFDNVNENDSHPISLFEYHVECNIKMDIDIVFNNHSMTIGIGEEVIELIPTKFTSYFKFGDQEMMIKWGDILINDLELPSNFSFYLEKCYIIDQYMHYVEEQEPHENFGGGMRQYMILDQDFEPVLINMGANLGWLS